MSHVQSTFRSVWKRSIRPNPPQTQLCDVSTNLPLLVVGGGVVVVVGEVGLLLRRLRLRRRLLLRGHRRQLPAPEPVAHAHRWLLVALAGLLSSLNLVAKLLIGVEQTVMMSRDELCAVSHTIVRTSTRLSDCR